MKKLLKFVLYTVCVVILLLLICFAILAYFIDPNDYKTEIEQQVQRETGRALHINGKIEWSLYPWLGFSTGALQFSNASGFSAPEFATVASSDIRIKLLPLLSKQLEIKRIVLKGLRLNLQTSAQGLNNWSDLANKQQSTDMPVQALAAFAIGGVSIIDADIVWDNQQSGQYVHIQALQLNMDKVVLNQPVAMQLAFEVHHQDNPATQTLELSSNILLAENMQQLRFDDTAINLILHDAAYPDGKISATLASKINIHLKQHSIQLQDCVITSGAIKLQAQLMGTDMLQNPSIKGSLNMAALNLRQLLQHYQQPIAPMQDTEALSHLAMQFTFSGNTTATQITDLSVKLDDTTLAGQLSITDYTQPEYNFDLHIDNIDADRYLPLKNNQQSGKGNRTKPLGTPATALAYALNSFPIQQLQQLNASGKLHIEQIIVNHLQLNNINLTLTAKDGLLNGQQNIQQLYQGSYNGELALNVQQPQTSMKINEQLSNVQLEPLLTDLYGVARMTGTVNASARLQAQGVSAQAITASLNGKLAFKFSEGVIRGFNLPKIINQGSALLKKNHSIPARPDNVTEYTSITAHGKINQGIISNHDLLARSGPLRINGQGTANLNNTALDYKVTTKLLKNPANEATQDNIVAVPVIIDVGGYFAQPSYKLNIKEMIPEQKQQKILNKVEKKFGKKASKFLKKYLK